MIYNSIDQFLHRFKRKGSRLKENGRSGSEISYSKKNPTDEYWKIWNFIVETIHRKHLNSFLMLTNLISEKFIGQIVGHIWNLSLYADSALFSTLQACLLSKKKSIKRLLFVKYYTIINF
jgi:hypothetical protein